ncbi:sodium bile acid symporter family protein [Hypoxylon sp. NC0597]|nr:sodium bile acid symporter family protein [Hypoxylon sp. NC0597]
MAPRRSSGVQYPLSKFSSNENQPPSPTSTEPDEKEPSSISDQNKQQKPIPKTRFTVFLTFVWWFIKDQWFIITLLLLILISSQKQVPRQQQQIKDTVVQNLAVAVIFLINGCTIPTQILVKTIRCWKIHIFVQVLCFLFTSSTALAVVTATATNPNLIDPALLNGIVLLGSLPTALSFNTIMTKKAQGNDALTLTESVIGSCLGPVVSTVLIQVYSSIPVWYAQTLPKAAAGYGAVFKQVFAQLGLTLFLPLIVGQLLRGFFPKQVIKIMTTYKGSKLASFALLILIWSAYDGAFETGALSHMRPTNVVFVVLISVALYLLWASLALFASVFWLSKEDSIAAVFCVATKTPALGVPLITLIFVGISPAMKAEMAIPMVVFQCIQTCLSSLATIVFRRWLRNKKEGAELM